MTYVRVHGETLSVRNGATEMNVIIIIIKIIRG